MAYTGWEDATVRLFVNIYFNVFSLTSVYFYTQMLAGPTYSTVLKGRNNRSKGEFKNKS